MLTFSKNGTVNKPAGTAAIDNTPNNLLGKTRNKLNVGKKYHSGKISRGVAKGFAGSPNGDGSNETWYLENIEFYKKAVVTIFNRWGQIVWESAAGYPVPFEGLNKNGAKLEDGVYYYIIDLKIEDKRQSVKKGYVTIIRDIR